MACTLPYQFTSYAVINREIKGVGSSVVLKSRKDLIEMIGRLRSQISELCSDGIRCFPTLEEIESQFVHWDAGGTSDSEIPMLHLGDTTEVLEYC